MRILHSIAVSLLALPAGAADSSIDWWSVDGGGGTSAGSPYAVTGTIGQPDAGVLRGGNFTLEGGFWGIVAAVITDTNAPTLTITRPAPDVVTVSWPRPAEGWVLEHTEEITGVPASWPQVPPPYETNASTISVSYRLTPPSGNHFFRLRKP